jgi:hypothetical protein
MWNMTKIYEWIWASKCDPEEEQNIKENKHAQVEHNYLSLPSPHNQPVAFTLVYVDRREILERTSTT